MYDVRVAEQGKELVYVRDRIDDWLLERGGINGITAFVLIGASTLISDLPPFQKKKITLPFQVLCLINVT